MEKDELLNLCSLGRDFRQLLFLEVSLSSVRGFHRRCSLRDSNFQPREFPHSHGPSLPLKLINTWVLELRSCLDTNPKELQVTHCDSDSCQAALVLTSQKTAEDHY